MNNRQQSQSSIMQHENLEEQHISHVLDSTPMSSLAVASGYRLNATNDNAFKNMSVCTVQLVGGDLATFWMHLT